MILVDLIDEEIKKYSDSLSDFTFNMNLENDLLLMPIVKNEEHFKYWSKVYPFYTNVQNEGVLLYAS